MCSDIDYRRQSEWAMRAHHLLGNSSKLHLDLACGTGQHIKCFIDNGYDCRGLDIHQGMLDIAKERCGSAHFVLANMTNFILDEPVDLITCFLYSLHYCQSIADLKSCIQSVHRGLNKGGMFCFNAVDKDTICNHRFEHHSVQHDNSEFVFASAWHYMANAEQQSLSIRIQKTQNDERQVWQDTHSMVAFSFEQLHDLLRPYFDVLIFEHDYTKLIEWDKHSGNATFVCVKA